MGSPVSIQRHAQHARRTAGWTPDAFARAMSRSSSATLLASLLVVTATAAYPRELERTAVLDDRSCVRLRPIRPDDERRLAEGYAHLSQRTGYRRFFTARRELPPQWLGHFTNVDYRRRLALVAEDVTRGEALVAVARYEQACSDDRAEVAFVIADAWRGRGLGKVLLDAILAAGEARGIRRFTADIQADNRAVLALRAHHTDVEDPTTEYGVTNVRFRRRPDPAGS
jgi:RimJ/RimL family protein N-acetyltransferase